MTPASDVSNWSHATLEQGWAEQRLYELGVVIAEKHSIVSADRGSVHIEHTVNGRQRALPCASLLFVTMRLPNDSVFQELAADSDSLSPAGIRSIVRIGDCLAPSTIAAAVYAGHRCARETDEPAPEGVPFKRELIEVLIRAWLSVSAQMGAASPIRPLPQACSARPFSSPECGASTRLACSAGGREFDFARSAVARFPTVPPARALFPLAAGSCPWPAGWPLAMPCRS